MNSICLPSLCCGAMWNVSGFRRRARKTPQDAQPLPYRVHSSRGGGTAHAHTADCNHPRVTEMAGIPCVGSPSPTIIGNNCVVPPILHRRQRSIVPKIAEFQTRCSGIPNRANPRIPARVVQIQRTVLRRQRPLSARGRWHRLSATSPSEWRAWLRHQVIPCRGSR